MLNKNKTIKILYFLVFFFFSNNALADWSNHALGWRAGETFREPFNKKNISKDIYSYTYTAGYDSGSDFFNLDYLVSNDNDPIKKNSSSGAKELYFLYRHTFYFKNLLTDQLPLISGIGLTAGVDLNFKKDAGYNSRKQMFVLGPTLKFNTPGFLNISLLGLWESNHPHAASGSSDPGYPEKRFQYDVHPMLNIVWGIPLNSGPISFEGYANFITSKGLDETGNATSPETNIDMRLMYDFSDFFRNTNLKFKMGLEYQYWRNKFGNSSAKVGDFEGNIASTSMFRFEVNF